MIDKKLNKESKEFLQKILLFIDSILINAISSEPKETDRILVSGYLNIKEAIYTQIVSDNISESIQKNIEDEKLNKKKED